MVKCPRCGYENSSSAVYCDNCAYLLSDADGIKINMLYLENDSKLYQEYKENPFHILSKDEYIEIVANQLEYLNKNIVIHRITGDPDKEKLVTPTWLIKKFVVLNDIDKYLKKNDIYQGKKA